MFDVIRFPFMDASRDRMFDEVIEVRGRLSDGCHVAQAYMDREQE